MGWEESLIIRSDVTEKVLFSCTKNVKSHICLFLRSIM